MVWRKDANGGHQLAAERLTDKGANATNDGRSWEITGLDRACSLVRLPRGLQTTHRSGQREGAPSVSRMNDIEQTSCSYTGWHHTERGAGKNLQTAVNASTDVAPW